MVKVSIIIPVYNEESTVRGVIKRVKDSVKGHIHEIIVVDDGSTDSSLKLLKKLKGIKVVKHPYNCGYGTSLKTGLKHSKYELILITDSDGTYPEKIIPELLKYADKHDMVVGARTGKNVNIPLLRRPAKWILTALATVLTNKRIPDMNSGLRVFRKDIALKFYNLFPERFSFTTTLTLALLSNNHSIKYIPIDYYKRKGSSSIHPVKDFVYFLSLIFRVLTYFRPFKMFSIVSLLILILAFAIFVYSSFILNRVLDMTVILMTTTAVQVFIFGLLADMILKLFYNER